MTIWSTAFGSMPAAARLCADHAGGRRDLAAGAGVDEDEFLAGIDDQRGERRPSLSCGMKAASSACSTSANGALRMNFSVIGRYQMPS